MLCTIELSIYLRAVQVGRRLQVHTEAMLFGLIGGRHASVASKKPAPFVGVLGLVVLFRFGRRARHVIRRIVRLVIRPILRVRVAVRSSGTIVTLPIHATFCNEISLLLVAVHLPNRIAGNCPRATDRKFET